MGIPATVGSFVGGFAGSSVVPEGALILVAGTFVIWQSVEFLIRARQVTSPGPSKPGNSSSHARGLFTPRRGFLEIAAGLIVGPIGGAVGLILGSVRLPLIIRLFRVDPRIAAGSNLVIGSFMGAFAFIGHRIRGQVDPILLLAMGTSGMAGTYVGAQLTGRATIHTLLYTMSAILMLVGVLLIRDGITRW